MTLWLSVIVAVVLVLSIWWWMRKPLYHRGICLDDFGRFFTSFLQTAGPNSLLFVQHEGSDRFVQFAKYVDDEEALNLHFGFPDAPWSREYFESVRSALIAADLPFLVRSIDADDDVRRFLVMDYLQARVDPVDLCRLVFGAMGVDAEATFTVHMEGSLDIDGSKEWLRRQEERHPPKAAR